MYKVLHVVNIYFVLPYFIGDQFVYFSNKGHNVHVICSPSEHLKDYAKKMKFSYKEVEIARAIKLFKDFKAILVICRYIKVNQINIVTGHTPKGGLLSMVAAYIMKVPKRIYFRHGLVYETAKGFKRKFLIFLEKVASFCATDVICVSPSVYKRSLEDNLNPLRKQHIFGKGTCTGIDIQNKFNLKKLNIEFGKQLKSKYNISEEGIVIGYCGRLVRDKGIIELIQAFDLLKRNHFSKRLYLFLVGMFENRDSLPEETITRIKQDKNIICTGFVNEFIENYYSLMNLFVLPSYREGFPTSILEASAMEIPVLTTKATGCVDSILENVTGKFIGNDSYSIANGIEFYLNNPTIAIQHGQNGREFVARNFDQELIWREIEKLYEK